MLDYSVKAKQLLADQLLDWPLAGINYSNLANVQVRNLSIANSIIKVQFNPARIISSAAKVDKQSIENRKCFLCTENRPAEQKHLEFGNYRILVNPFPIFPEHFTIPAIEHIPQAITGKFGDMLILAEAMSDFIIFYNGPRCGASAPDHFHFQAGTKGFLPIENEIEQLKEFKGEKLWEGKSELWSLNDGFRKFLLLEGVDRMELEKYFIFIYKKLETIAADAINEPLMNILASFENGKWQVFIFPRFSHRPWQYFEEGEKNILLSPASVDMGGVIITPLEKDFRKIRKEDIADIFGQVLWPDERFLVWTEELKKRN